MSIDIPKSVTGIDDAFSECISLKEIIIHKPKGTITGAPWGATIGERAIIWDS